jgi:membrane protease YdiL (CAAX protease family)
MLALVVSAILFAAVHLSKDPREFLVSIPNGALLAYAAYRTDTWLVPCVLHGVAAVTSYLLILAFA